RRDARGGNGTGAALWRPAESLRGCTERGRHRLSTESRVQASAGCGVLPLARVAEHSSTYSDRIQSDEWRALRARLLSERGTVCEHCGNGTGVLQLHHITYERLGN